MSISTHSDELQCRFESWEVAGPRSLVLRMPEDNCCDMRAAVRIAQAILPSVEAVHTLEGPLFGTTYWKDNDGIWFSDNRGGRHANALQRTRTALVTNSGAAQEYCDMLSSITGAGKVCVEKRPLYVAVNTANYGRLSAIITECQGSGPHLSMAMTGFGYDSFLRPVIFNGRLMRGRKVELIAQAVNVFLSSELPEIAQ